MNSVPEIREGEAKSSGSFHMPFLAAVSLAMCMALCSCRTSAQAQFSSERTVPFIEPAHHDSAIPSPESILGHGVAEEAVRYHVLVRYLQALANASERATLSAYGQTHEGRTLYYLTITSPANHARLEQIRKENAELSDPRGLGTAERADALVATLPAVAWLNYSIHGDELSSTDAAMYVAYHLTAATDSDTRRLLDAVVVHIVPLVNPDGRERYLSHLEQLTGVVSSPDVQSMQHQALWSRGRGNHYLFDLNRDWLVHVQPEVRALAEVMLSWNPHLVVDSHEQGAYETYLFDPPREPLNIHLSPSVLEWRRRFSADQADAFNRYGWSYYTEDWYSEWSPIYTNAWASLQGSIGLLYEQARVDAASVKHPTGHEMSYREAVHHQVVSSFANLETLRGNRHRILRDFVRDRQWAVAEDGAGAKFFLLPPSDDMSRWKRLVELLERQGIEIGFAQEPFEAENTADMWRNKRATREFPQGTLVARIMQPHRRMLQALCEFDPHLQDTVLVKERTELENRRETLFYDVSTWNLPMSFGLESYWAESIPDVTLRSRPPDSDSSVPRLNRRSGYGYLIDFGSSCSYSVLVRLLEEECHPRIATKPFQTKTREYEAGAILLRNHENPDSLFDTLQQITADFGISVRAVNSALTQDGPDLGSAKFELLAAPRVAIASQWPIRSTSFGSIWYLLDYHLRLQTSPINIQSISRIDLRKYNVLILPDSADIARVLDEKATGKIRRWVEAGGTLIAVAGSAAFAASTETELSSVRLKRDVLGELDEYREAVKRERNARNIKIDPNNIWDVEPVVQDTAQPEAAKEDVGKSDEPKSKPDVDKLKRNDEWCRIFSPTGTSLTGTVNPEHWLGFGLRERLPVLFWGRYAFLSKHPVETVVRFTDKNDLRLSGLLWPEARERLAQTAYATVESVGNGQVILFATDPTYRMWLAGLQRLFLNAVLLGPGMGASQPLPW